MKPIRKGSFRYVQEYNQRLVLKLIQERAPISRYDLAKLTKLSPTTVGNVVEELLSLGLIQELGAGESAGGRPPRLLALNTQGGQVLSLSLLYGVIGVADLGGAILRREKLPLDLEDLTPAQLAEAVRAFLAQWEAKGGEKGEEEGRPDEGGEFIGLGVCVPGLVEPETGRVRLSAPLGWRDVPLQELLNEVLGLPVYVENDARAMALREKWVQSSLPGGARDFVYINLGRGIGAVIVSGGEIHRGARQMAGEFGHMSIAWEGPPCRCGGYGCIEAFAAEPVVLRESGCRQVEELLAAVAAGDRRAQEAISRAARYLGVGVANIVNFLNPAQVIIGGALTQAGEVFFAPLREEVRKRALPLIGEAVEILPAAAAEDAAEAELAAGAALVLERLFQLPALA